MQQVDCKNSVILGKRIKKLRLKKDKSLNKFVMKHGGLTTASWSRLENGKFDAKFSTLVKAAGMLNITLSELFLNIDLDYTITE